MMNITHEEKLKIFERKILRSIYGPVQDTNNEWRVRTNQEIEVLIKKKCSSIYKISEISMVWSRK
jgi:hypothetical protein